LRVLAHEPLRVRGVRLGENAGSLVADGVGGAVVDVSGGVQTQAGVAVLVVVLMRVILSRTVL
jgi:hypothetical protein